jgi:MFS family permease
MVLGMSFVEGTATDWLNLAAVDGHHLSAAGGGIAFAAFMAGMLLGRVSGGMLLDRLGRRTTLLITGILAVFGVVAFLFSPSPQLIAVASAVWGVGASLGFPVGMSIAADRPGDTSAQVSTVSVFGYAASLVGPLVIGLASAQFGLLPAFGLVLGASALSLLIVPFVTRATR